MEPRVIFCTPKLEVVHDIVKLLPIPRSDLESSMEIPPIYSRQPPDGHEFPDYQEDNKEPAIVKQISDKPPPIKPREVWKSKYEPPKNNVRDKIAMFSNQPATLGKKYVSTENITLSDNPEKFKTISRSELSLELKDDTKIKPTQSDFDISLPKEEDKEDERPVYRRLSGRSMSLCDVSANRPDKWSLMVEQRRKCLSKLKGLVIPEHIPEIEMNVQPFVDLPEIKSEINVPIFDEIKSTPKSDNSKPNFTEEKKLRPSSYSFSPKPSQTYSPAFKWLQKFKTSSPNEESSTAPSMDFDKSLEKPSPPTEYSKLTVNVNNHHNQSDPPKSLESITSPTRSDYSFEYIYSPDVKSKTSNGFLEKPKLVNHFLEDESDNDSALSSSQSSYISRNSPPASPTNMPPGHTILPKTETNYDSLNRRLLKAQSVEAINRKNILASARCRSGRDLKVGSPLIQRKFEDDQQQNGGNLPSLKTDSSSLNSNDFKHSLTSVTSLNLSVTSADLPVTSADLPVTSADLSVTSADLSVTSADLSVTSADLSVTSADLSVTSADLPVTSTNVSVTSTDLSLTPTSLSVTSTGLSVTNKVPERQSEKPIIPEAHIETIKVTKREIPTLQQPPTEKLRIEKPRIESRIESRVELRVEKPRIEKQKFEKLKIEKPEVQKRVVKEVPISNLMSKLEKEKELLVKFEREVPRKLPPVSDLPKPRNFVKAASVNDLRKNFEKETTVPMPRNSVSSCTNIKLPDPKPAKRISLPPLAPPQVPDNSVKNEEFSKDIEKIKSIILQEYGTIPEEDLKIVHLKPDVSGGSIGITLAGGADYETKEITIHKIRTGSPAYRDGRLQKGDRILFINGKTMRDLSHSQSLKVLKENVPEVMIAACSMKDIPATQSPRRQPSIDSGNSTKIVETKTEDVRKLDNVIEVVIHKDAAGLGFSIQGGQDSPQGNVPLVIKKLFVGGAAEKSGKLQSGDELLEINGIDVTPLSRIDAWNVMKKLPEGDVVIRVRR